MLQPLRDFVVVEKLEAEKQTASGLYIATQEEKICKGRVIAVGSGKLLSDWTSTKLEVNVGDVVCFSKTSGVEVKDSDKNLLLLREESLFCICK